MDPNQLTPVPGNPNIRYDRFGWPYVQDVSGHWVQLYAPTMVTSQSVPTATHGFPAVSQNETASTRPHNNMEDGPNQPLSEALVIVTSTRAPTASPSTAVIDLALLPLPEVSDDDLSDPVTIVKSRGHAAAKKVAGSRQKGKGKQRAVLTESRDKGKEKATARKHRHASDDEEVEVVAKRGRPKGAGNYTADEVDALLDFVEEELPLGQCGWQSIHRGFTHWARRNDAAERTLKSLETKFKQLVKTTKPTGDAYCPPDVKQAHKIDGRINERAATRDLNDSDFDDAAQLTVQHVQGKMRCEERYPEGGIHTYWVTDPSSTSGESDKENEDPNFFRRRCDIDYRDQPSSSSSSGHHFGIELQALTTSQPNAATATAGKDQDGEEGDDDDIYVKDADGPKDE
ncbi:unnamed protein product [Cyclocybe aegerita]|uniref:DUF6818 domain-containing protein n=1 Tax=Cyclocybe aegerita TaxID=1973307 RepID=A0A8S0VZ84_CYCAE|nr:unnamed protein product [Cyclocybe aegerita]